MALLQHPLCKSKLLWSSYFEWDWNQFVFKIDKSHLHGWTFLSSFADFLFFTLYVGRLWLASWWDLRWVLWPDLEWHCQYTKRAINIFVVVLLHAQCMSTTESCVVYLSQRELFAFTLEMCHLQESHFILEQTELCRETCSSGVRAKLILHGMFARMPNKQWWGHLNDTKTTILCKNALRKYFVIHISPVSPPLKTFWSWF